MLRYSNTAHSLYAHFVPVILEASALQNGSLYCLKIPCLHSNTLWMRTILLQTCSKQYTRVMKCKDQLLGLVTSYKYLGVDITNDLNMDEYVSNVYKKKG